MPGVMSQIGIESNGVNCIFANKRNWVEIFGAPVYYLKPKIFLSSISLLNGAFMQIRITTTPLTRFFKSYLIPCKENFRKEAIIVLHW